MGLFSRLKGKGGGSETSSKKTKSTLQNGAAPAPPPKPRWDDAWTRKDVEPEEVQELLRGCTIELKSRALDMPFLLLPFRPASDPSAARTFIRNYFSEEKGPQLVGARLEQELLLTEPMVLSSVMKWCWSRLVGGVVTWEAYELFKVGETDSDFARDAFATFIPLSVESDARSKIIFDYFDLMAAIAAHGKTNGMGGRKLSRLAGWWAFEQVESSNGFDMGYKSWVSAADATSHLFFAYLRSLSPDSVRGINGISNLPLSLQTLVQETRYPPENSPYHSTSKVSMVVGSVSPTPFALLRRSRNFHYRDDDVALQRFSDFEDPVQALTEECRRVLKGISSANQSDASTTQTSTSLGDSSWSRFEDMGFGGGMSYNDDENDESALGKKRKPVPGMSSGLKTAPQTKTNDLGRPTTPSWADFLSSGFVEDSASTNSRPLLLPPDKILPPIDLDGKRGKSSQSHIRPNDSDLEPGELASITAMKLDDAFWWVWITSLAGEETGGRKSVFGRCALVETTIGGGAWLVFEEIVKGAAPEPEMGAYVAEKKSRFTFGKKSKMSRTKSMGRSTVQPQLDPYNARNKQATPASKVSIGPDQHARIQAAAAALQQKQRQHDTVGPLKGDFSNSRRGRGDANSTKTNSVFTLQPVIMSEGAPAMKWANNYDKSEVRAAYLGNNFTGKGSGIGGSETGGSVTPKITPQPPKKDTPKQSDYGFPADTSQPEGGRGLPSLPLETPNENLQTPGAPAVTASNVPDAPLPVESEPRRVEAASAAHVPLPASTPLEPSSAPPAPPVATDDGEPLEPTITNTQESINGVDSSASPLETKRDPKKLKKQPGQGGLRNIFGKKKNTERTPPGGPAPTTQAVAAARAAYTGPATKSNYTSAPSSQNPPQSTLGRRLSAMGRKKPTPTTNTAVNASPTIADETEPTASGALPAPPTAPFATADKNYSQASMTSTQHEARQAESEFRTFDSHGPVDAPAFVPEDDSPRPSFVPDESADPSRPSTTATEEPAHRPMYAPPLRKGVYESHGNSEGRRGSEEDWNQLDHDGEEEEEEEQGGADPRGFAKNRWSQIRRNAAERAGRASEDQRTEGTGVTAGGTEDGEESGGEETIESRVARIKARVAELTGGMPPPSSTADATKA